MHGITVSMDQKDKHAVVYFAGDDATCVVFPSIGGMPKIFGIMIGLDSTDSLQ